MQIPKNIKAIIFDYDGVLGDSDKFNTYACKESAKKCGITLEESIYRKCAPGGATIKDIATCIVTHYGMPEKVDEYIDYKRRYDKEYIEQVQSLPNAVLAITQLSKLYKLAVNTGTRHALVEGVLDKYGMIKYFKTIIAAEDIHNGKPDPESYLLVCEILNLQPTECMIVEDGVSGVIAGVKAGCYVVGITNSIVEEKLVELGCKEVISDLSELMAPTSA